MRKLIVALACLAFALAACSTSTSTSKPVHSRKPVHYLRAGMIYDGIRLPKQFPTIAVKPQDKPTGRSKVFSQPPPTEQNENWAGWAEYYPPPGGPNTTVANLNSPNNPIIAATFVMPTLNCTNPNDVLSMWVGFGGDPTDGNAGLLTQDGIDAFCPGSIAAGLGKGVQYVAFDEDIAGNAPYPSDMEPYLNYGTANGFFGLGATSAGDVIQVFMEQATQSDKDIYAIKDDTTGNTLLLDVKGFPSSSSQWNTSQGFDDSTGEVIVEDPGAGNNGGFAPYPGYQQVSINHVFSIVDEGPEFQPAGEQEYVGAEQSASQDPNGVNANWTATPTPVVDVGAPANPSTWAGGEFTVTPSDTPPAAPTPTPTTTPTPMNPPADALAAWNATDNGCATTMAASLRNVASLLPSSDATQIADLNQFAGLPLSELGEGTQQQQTEGNADLAALNTFFGTDRALTTFTGSCSAPPTTPPTTTPPTTPGGNGLLTPGNGSPRDAVDGFYQSELAGDWAAVCSYVTPSAQSLCLAGTSGQAAATGNATVGTMVVSADGNEALVSVTGSICAPSTPCVSNSDANLGMPSSPSQFATDYQTAVANSTSDSSTSISPMPCSQINGKWYVDFGRHARQEEMIRRLRAARLPGHLDMPPGQVQLTVVKQSRLT